MFKNSNYTIELYNDGTYSFNKNTKPMLSRQQLEEQNEELNQIVHDYAKIIEELKIMSKQQEERIKQLEHELATLDGLYASDKEDMSEPFRLDFSEILKE